MASHSLYQIAMSKSFSFVALYSTNSHCHSRDHSENALGYRRPKTTNPGDFWYISQHDWDALLRDAQLPEVPANKGKRKNAYASLRKFDHAGRIMETAEGICICSCCTK